MVGEDQNTHVVNIVKIVAVITSYFPHPWLHCWHRLYRHHRHHDHNLVETGLTCSVPLNLGGISTLAQFIESHHCKRVTRVHLELAHLIMIITMMMMMMMMMMTVNSDALWGKTSTKR